MRWTSSEVSATTAPNAKTELLRPRRDVPHLALEHSMRPIKLSQVWPLQSNPFERAAVVVLALGPWSTALRWSSLPHEGGLAFVKVKVKLSVNVKVKVKVNVANNLPRSATVLFG